MKAFAIALLGLTLPATFAAAGTTTCTAYRETAPGKFDKVIATKQLEDKDGPVFLFRRNLISNVFVNPAAGNGKYLSILVGNTLRGKIGVATVSEGRSLTMIDRDGRFMVSCERQ